MRKKNKIIISLIIFTIGIIVMCAILSTNNKNNNTKISNKKTHVNNHKYNNQKSKMDDNKISEDKNSTTNSKSNIASRINSDTHNHNWKELGYYAEESGWAGAEEVSEIYKDVNCVYTCKICHKCDLYRDDVNSVNDLRNHLKECTYDSFPAINVDSMTDQEVMSNFLVCKQISSKVFIRTGFKCTACGKKITAQQAIDLGIIDPRSR